MIVEERMRTYINSLDMGNTPFLEELEKEALAGRVPIIRKEMQSFLKMFLAATRPMKILEVGTAVGFSTLLMCEYGPENLKITTIENYEKRIPIARENFRKAGRESQIEFLTGDAGEILKSKGLIDDSLVFFAQEKLSTYKGQMQAGTYLLSTAYTPTRIMGILAGDEEQTGVTQDSATAADTAAQTDTQTTDAGTDTADTQSADGTADTQAADGTAGEGESGQ